MFFFKYPCVFSHRLDFTSFYCGSALAKQIVFSLFGYGFYRQWKWKNQRNAKLMGWIFLFLIPFILASSEPVSIRPVNDGDISFLNKVDHKYQENHGIHIKFKKTVHLAALGSQRQSEGEIWVDKGKMRLEVHRPEPSKIIADSHFLWIENPPPKDFKGAKTQVFKASLKSKRAKTQGLLQILIQGGVLNYFRVSGVQTGEKQMTYFLQPNNQSIEFKRARIRIKIMEEEISQIRYWDQMDNETTFDFLIIEFNRKIEKTFFEYKPPADAEIMTY